MNKNQHMPNEDLKVRIKASDSDAFDSLYLQYYHKLFHFFWVRTNSEELAKDFIQDVFVRIWNNREVNIEFPVIFTTAHNQYAIQAFKVNSIDYILKPIQKEALKFSLDKYQKIYQNRTEINYHNISKLISEFGLSSKKKTKKTFLIHDQDRILPVSVSDFAYFFIKNTIVYGITLKKEKYTIDQQLDSIEHQISSDDFYRVNRQYIVSRKAIKEVAHYFNGRLKLKVIPAPHEELFVSKAKASEFKHWFGS